MRIDPEEQLTHLQRAQLSATVATEGFEVIKLIMTTECEKFTVALLNANKDAEVLVAHKLAKSAAQFFIAVSNRINSEAEIYRFSPKASDKPEDVTKGKLDIGEYVENFSDIEEEDYS